MKLIELEIENVRGITHLSLKPNGNNFVVWGPNGSGKSAVVDAIDFLLTGRISRLMGEGTRGIHLNEHGPHIDHEPKDAIVRAVIELPGISEPFEIKRCMERPTVLECDESIMPSFEPVMTLARRGQHVLTRREILKYITSDGSTRAREIQNLLNVTEIDDVRKAFVNVKSSLKVKRQALEHVVETAKGLINATIQEESFQEDMVLQLINQSRTVLGGQEIFTIYSKELKTGGLTPPSTISKEKAVNLTLFERDIQNLLNVTVERNQTEIREKDEQLRKVITTIHSDPNLLQALNRLELIELGISLIDEGGSCPLCDTSWPEEKLHEYLEQKLSTGEKASQHKGAIFDLSTFIANQVNNTLGSLQEVIETLRKTGNEKVSKTLALWFKDLKKLSSALSEAIEKYPLSDFDSDMVKKMLAPNDIAEQINIFRALVKEKAPQITPEQTAWDTLTRLEENLKALEQAQNEFGMADLSYKRAVILLSSFVNARDSVLETLYDEVRDRFVELYKKLHGSDEECFSANIVPDGAALNFEVGFYGRGTHSPHALHSEGHQDSMGLCLYLALSELLAEGLIDLIILDDVVMSVDTAHRRNLCRILASSFPDRQFLITTHDKTWANQLSSEGVVTRTGLVEFYNWNIDTGPQVSHLVDLWDRIEEDIRRNDIPSAAGKLRRGLEQYFGLVCDSLRIQVRYELNGQQDLGDFTIPLMDRYRNLIKKAKKSAISWNNTELQAKFDEMDSVRKEIYTRTYAEQWAMNANVHYNEWTNFSENDFRPVVEAFQDLCGLFKCGSCGGMLKLTMTVMKPVEVRCNCGSVNWNLVGKET
ncbi:AAA family ATPase [Halobacteriota archaeon]